MTTARENVATLVSMHFHDEDQLFGELVRECSPEELQSIIAVLVPLVTNYVCHVGQHLEKAPETAVQAFCLYQLQQSINN